MAGGGIPDYRFDEPQPPPDVTPSVPRAATLDFSPFDDTIPGHLGNLKPTPLLAWGMQIDYETDTGLRCAPPAAPNLVDPATQTTPYQQFYRAHAGSTRKTITCIAVAADQNNLQLPAPQTISQVNNGNDVLVAWRVIGFTPENFMDGIQSQAAMIILIYECQAMLQLGVDTLDLGASPFDKTPAAQNILTPGEFNSLLNQASQAAGFKGGPITY
jgi:hypothetical protein